MWFYGDELMIYRLFMAYAMNEQARTFHFVQMCTLYFATVVSLEMLLLVLVAVCSYFPTFQEVPCHSLIIRLPYIEIDYFIYQLLAFNRYYTPSMRCVCVCVSGQLSGRNRFKW